MKYGKFGSICAPKLTVFQIYTINGNNIFIKYGINSREIALLLPQPSQWCQYTVKQLWKDGCLMLDFWCDSNRSSLQLKCNIQKCQGFFQLFAQAGGGGRMRLYGLLEGGKYVSMCKACGKLGGSEGMPPPGNFGPLIRCNLVESGTVFAQT